MGVRVNVGVQVAVGGMGVCVGVRVNVGVQVAVQVAVRVGSGVGVAVWTSNVESSMKKLDMFNQRRLYDVVHNPVSRRLRQQN